MNIQPEKMTCSNAPFVLCPLICLVSDQELLPKKVHTTNPPSKKQVPLRGRRLDELELVGSDVEGIDVGCKAGVGLLGAVGATERVSHTGSKVSVACRERHTG